MRTLQLGSLPQKTLEAFRPLLVSAATKLDASGFVENLGEARLGLSSMRPAA
jgi:hypothetical protein